MAFGLGLGIGFCRRFGTSTVPGLFALAEPGVWYDPSDLTTLFQDTAGTQTVTTPGQTVALALDKSKGLVLGGEIVVNGNFATNSAASWVEVVNGGTLNASTGQLVVNNAAGTGNTGVYQVRNCTAGQYLRVTLDVIARTEARLAVFNGTLGATIYSNNALPVGTSTYLVGPMTSGTFTVYVHCSAGNTATFDNISVRELPGFHATQATAASRPTYGIVPRTGRRNLLVQTEAMTNAAWIFTGSARTLNYGIAPDSTQTSTRLQFSGANQDLRQTATVGAVGTSSVWVKGVAGETVAFLNNLTDTVSLTTLTGSWQQLIRTGPTSNATLWLIGTWDGATARDFEVWRPQLETGSTATSYQRVGTQFDVTEAGVASLSYLSFDGVDDFLVTPTITPGTDKAQVFAGVRKLSDAAAGMLLETSGSFFGTNGTIAIVSPWEFYINGTAPAGWQSTRTAPVTDVLTMLADISGATRAEEVMPRINGSVPSLAGGLAGPAGTGNFLAYPLYIGRRGGTSLPFNGQIYSLIVRFGANLDANTIINTETWVNSKTGAF